MVIVVAVVVACLATRGSSRGASVEFVLGAGTADTGAGPRRAVTGELQSMTTDARGDVALFTRDGQGYELWTVDPGGAVMRTRVPALDRFGQAAMDQAAQSAAAPDGSLYLALDTAGLWKVTRDGRATRVVGPRGDSDIPDEVPVERFSAWAVNGVAVADDGTVFFSDTQNGPYSVLIHRLRSAEVTRIAGRPLRKGQQAPRENPNLLAPKTGGPADETYLPEYSNAAPLAWNDGTLYLHTGRGVLRIAMSTERIYPVVAARDTGSLKHPASPFKPFGKAINGYVGSPRGGDDAHDSSIAVDRASGDLYYGAGDALPGDTAGVSENFRWSGDLTRSQRDFFGSLPNEEQTIYQVDRAGELSVVTAGARALSTANGYLYIAVDSCSSGEERCDTTDHRSAVVRLRLPGARD